MAELPSLCGEGGKEGVTGGAGQPLSPGAWGEESPTASARGFLGRGRAPGLGEGSAGQPGTVGPAREPQWEARGPAPAFGHSCGCRWRWAEVEPGTAVVPICKWDVEERKGEEELALSRSQAALPSLGALG